MLLLLVQQLLSLRTERHFSLSLFQLHKMAANTNIVLYSIIQQTGRYYTYKKIHYVTQP